MVIYQNCFHALDKGMKHAKRRMRFYWLQETYSAELKSWGGDKTTAVSYVSEASLDVGVYSDG